MTQSDGQHGFHSLPIGITSRENPLEPFEWYAQMRQEAPVHYNANREMWDVFRYADVQRVITEDETFSSDRIVPVSDPSKTDVPEEPAKNMLGVDPPEHDRLRGFVDERFRPRTIQEKRPFVEQAAADVLDTVEIDTNRAEATFDLVSEFAYPFPVTVIAALLDIPTTDREQFKQWSHTLIAERKDGNREAIQQARNELFEYFGARIDERTGGSGEDLITLAANADELSREETISFCILLLIAGNITTTNLITNSIWALSTHNFLDDIRTGSLKRTQAIEEVLRYRSPIQSISRVTTESVEIGGTEIGAGELVMAWNGSANRDPAMFDAPTEFRPERNPNPHMAFGRGTHFCLGAPLARLEADVALELLVDRFEAIEPTDVPKQPTESRLLYGLAELPVYVRSDSENPRN
jgi:cytochrome P450